MDPNHEKKHNSDSQKMIRKLKMYRKPYNLIPGKILNPYEICTYNSGHFNETFVSQKNEIFDI